MKKVFDTLIVALLIFASAVLVVQVVQAQNDNSLDSKTKERLQRIEQKVSTGSSKNVQKDNKARGKHTLGTIRAINGSIILVDNKNTTQQILTDAETDFLQVGDRGRTNISLRELRIGDRVAVYGIAKDQNTGTAEAVVRLTKSQPARHALFGKITLVNGSTFTISHIQQEKVLGTVVANNSTEIKGKSGNLTTRDLSAGVVIAVSGTVDNRGVITAKRIFVVPGKGLQKNGTSSATPSAR